MTQTMTKPATKPASKKVVFILRRYEVKAGRVAGSVCNVVRSIKMVKGQEVTAEYQVWTRPDGCTTCNCDARKPCYHMMFVQEAEDERKEREAEAEREQVELLAELDEIVASQMQDEPTTTQPVVSVPAIAPTKTSASTAIVALKTPPTVRNVSQDWLLKGSRSGTFSGRVA